MNTETSEVNKGNILIVDDNPINLRLLVDILSKNGYKVRPVPNGKLALAAARGLPPDLILLDIMMPEIDGYQVCEALKADATTADIPVIFISAINEVLDKVRAFQVGGIDYITKPFQIEEVLIRVQTHIKVSTLQKKLQNQAKSLTETVQQLELTRDQLIHTEKMAALGQLIAGIAHEINTPMGAIRSSVENLSGFFEENLSDLPGLFRSIPPDYEDYLVKLIKKYSSALPSYSSREKRQFKRNLIAELESLDIENADNLADTLVDLGVHTSGEMEEFLPLLQSEYRDSIIDTAYRLTTLQTSTKTIKIAADKASKIVYSLRVYARYDNLGELVYSSITEGIETILTLYHNQIKQGVEVIRNYREIPNIWCYADELNQVWTNLISNALQAMQYQGTLNIEIDGDENSIVVKITDSGQGIPPEVKDKIFQPFFTTKSKGEGTGLGLDIVKKIVEKHRGTIEVESVPGKTTFTVRVSLDLKEDKI